MPFPLKNIAPVSNFSTRNSIIPGPIQKFPSARQYSICCVYWPISDRLLQACALPCMPNSSDLADLHCNVTNYHVKQTCSPCKSMFIKHAYPRLNIVYLCFPRFYVHFIVWFLTTSNTALVFIPNRKWFEWFGTILSRKDNESFLVLVWRVPTDFVVKL